MNLLLQVIYRKRPGQESGSCQRTYKECEFEVKDKSGDTRRRGKKKKEIKLKVIMTKKAESAGNTFTCVTRSASTQRWDGNWFDSWL